MQWLDTEQSQEAKDHVEREVRWAAERWQRMLHEEKMEEKRKKDQEDIRKRIAEVEHQEAVWSVRVQKCGALWSSER